MLDLYRASVTSLTCRDEGFAKAKQDSLPIIMVVEIHPTGRKSFLKVALPAVFGLRKGQ